MQNASVFHILCIFRLTVSRNGEHTQLHVLHILCIFFTIIAARNMHNILCLEPPPLSHLFDVCVAPWLHCTCSPTLLVNIRLHSHALRIHTPGVCIRRVTFTRNTFTRNMLTRNISTRNALTRNRSPGRPSFVCCCSRSSPRSNTVRKTFTIPMCRNMCNRL
jgi:hypothetical protein